jgi:hypothetical protein
MSRNKKNQKKSKFSIPLSLPQPKLNLAPETKRGIAVVVFVVLSGHHSKNRS